MKIRSTMMAVLLGATVLVQAGGYYYQPMARPVRQAAVSRDCTATADDAEILRRIRCECKDQCLRFDVNNGFVMVYGPRDAARSAVRVAIEVQGVHGTDYIAQ